MVLSGKEGLVPLDRTPYPLGWLPSQAGVIQHQNAKKGFFERVEPGELGLEVRFVAPGLLFQPGFSRLRKPFWCI